MKTKQKNLSPESANTVIDGMRQEINRLDARNATDIATMAEMRSAHAKEVNQLKSRIAEVLQSGRSWFELCQTLRKSYLVKFAVNEVPQDVEVPRIKEMEQKEVISHRLAVHSLISAAPYDPALEPKETDSLSASHQMGMVESQYPRPVLAYGKIPEPYYAGSLLYGPKEI